MEQYIVLHMYGKNDSFISSFIFFKFLNTFSNASLTISYLSSLSYPTNDQLCVMPSAIFLTYNASFSGIILSFTSTAEHFHIFHCQYIYSEVKQKFYVSVRLFLLKPFTLFYTILSLICYQLLVFNLYWNSIEPCFAINVYSAFLLVKQISANFISRYIPWIQKYAHWTPNNFIFS